MTDQATYVRTATVPLDELTPFPGNAKRGNVAAILESLRRNAQFRSLVVREIATGPLIVLAGNHTMQALAIHGAGDCGKTVSTGRGPVPCGVCQNDPAWQPGARCEIVHCDDDTARRVNIVDNRAADLGTYDFEALAGLLDALEELEGTGYTAQDVDDITALLALPQDDVKGDPAPTAGSSGAGSHDGDPNDGTPESFLPVITLRVSHVTFDRWRDALDTHPGQDDTDKLLGLLGEIEAARAQAAA